MSLARATGLLALATLLWLAAPTAATADLSTVGGEAAVGVNGTGEACRVRLVQDDARARSAAIQSLLRRLDRGQRHALPLPRVARVHAGAPPHRQHLPAGLRDAPGRLRRRGAHHAGRRHRRRAPAVHPDRAGLAGGRGRRGDRWTRHRARSVPDQRARAGGRRGGPARQGSGRWRARREPVGGDPPRRDDRGRLGQADRRPGHRRGRGAVAPRQAPVPLRQLCGRGGDVRTLAGDPRARGRARPAGGGGDPERAGAHHRAPGPLRRRRPGLRPGREGGAGLVRPGRHADPVRLPRLRAPRQQSGRMHCGGPSRR